LPIRQAQEKNPAQWVAWKSKRVLGLTGISSRSITPQAGDPKNGDSEGGVQREGGLRRVVRPRKGSRMRGL